MDTQAQPTKSKTPTVVIVIVVIVGLLLALFASVLVFAALAGYGTTKYLQNAKTAEARATLGAIMRLAASSHAKTGKLCPSASSPVPASPAAVSGKKYMSATSEWNADSARDAGFACIGFSMSMPQYFQYSYQVMGDDVVATAHGDLNGDGKLSTFTLRGKVVGGEVKIAPSIEELDPFE